MPSLTVLAFAPAPPIRATFPSDILSTETVLRIKLASIANLLDPSMTDGLFKSVSPPLPA